jgi:hypothetical protein
VGGQAFRAADNGGYLMLAGQQFLQYGRTDKPVAPIRAIFILLSFR